MMKDDNSYTAMQMITWMFIAYIMIWAIEFGISTPWGTVCLDIIPPAIRIV